MYAGFISSREDENYYMLPIDSLEIKLDSFNNMNQIPIAIMDYRVDKISLLAVQNGDVYESNEKIYSIPNLSISPFDEVNYLFSIPGVQEKTVDTLEFIFPSELFFSNKNNTYSMEADFSDGSRYQSILFDKPYK